MKSQITMKDLAEHFGVSLSTVHKAIVGKPGVSEATRKKIVDYANAKGFVRNSMAAALKKKTISIAVCFPEVDENSKYFYDFVWQGYKKCLKEWGDYNIKIIEIPYENKLLDETLINIDKKFDENNKIDGLLTVPPRDEIGLYAVKHLIEKGVCVVFVTEDSRECNRLGYVGGDYYSAGRIMGEQVCNILQPGSRILLMAGNEYKDSHYLISKGFHEYVRRNVKENVIKNFFGYYNAKELEKGLEDLLCNDPPDAVCCVFARGSAMLSRLVKRCDLAGKITIIANDVFDESVAALMDGTFTNIVFKDPYKQGYLAMKMLCEYLIKGIEPKEREKMVETVMIFRSNVDYYWKNAKHMDYIRK